jgi:GTP-binding protein
MTTGGDLTPDELAAGDALFRRPWSFVRSVPSLETLPDPDRPEVAFAGRSNVGKSSLINALVNRHGLARTSNTPGRTQELNFFETIGVALFLVDMPGYGFAQAPKAKVDQWTRLVRTYLRGRRTLARVFLLIDARHGLKDADRPILSLMDEAAVSYQAVLTKIDKVKPTDLARTRQQVAAALQEHPAAYPAILATSSQTMSGLAELRAEIARLVATP